MCVIGVVPSELKHVPHLLNHVGIVRVEGDACGGVKVGPLHVARADVHELVADDELAVAHSRVSGVHSIRTHHVIPTRNLNQSNKTREKF